MNQELTEPGVVDGTKWELYLLFNVYGKAQTQGSKRSVAIYRKGSDGKPVPVMKGGRVVTRTINDNKNLTSWREQVASAAANAHTNSVLCLLPIKMQVTFTISRPLGHYGTGKNEHVVKPSSPIYHTQKPDSMKLVRAIEDSMTGVVYHDDSQIVAHEIIKCWGWQHCTSVALYVPGNE
jgi:crossover junction endodeoxyribonuclease RusA